MYMVWKWRGEGRGGDYALFLLGFFLGGGGVILREGGREVEREGGGQGRGKGRKEGKKA